MPRLACVLHKIDSKYFNGGSCVTRAAKKSEVIEPGHAAESKWDSVVTMEALCTGAPGAFSVITFPDGAFERGRKVAGILGGRFYGRDRSWVDVRSATIIRRRRRRGT